MGVSWAGKILGLTEHGFSGKVLKGLESFGAGSENSGNYRDFRGKINWESIGSHNVPNTPGGPPLKFIWEDFLGKQLRLPGAKYWGELLLLGRGGAYCRKKVL